MSEHIVALEPQNLLSAPRLHFTFAIVGKQVYLGSWLTNTAANKVDTTTLARYMREALREHRQDALKVGLSTILSFCTQTESTSIRRT